MKAARGVVLALAALGLAACSTTLPPPSATLGNLEAIRSAGLAPLSVGDFTAGPGAPSQMDRSVSVRADSQAAPGGSFAKFLGQTLEAELKGAGKFDPASHLVVSGVVTDTHVDSGLPNGSARLAARFTLTKGGATAFDKTLAVEATWPSALLGAAAIPDAFNHYNALFPALVGKLVTDPQFRAAAKLGG